MGQFGPLPSLAERQERLWSYDPDAGTPKPVGQELSGADFSQQSHEDLTPLEPDIEARARAGSF